MTQDSNGDYFDARPKYSAETFHTRYRMSKPLVLKIVREVEATNEFIQEGWDERKKRV